MGYQFNPAKAKIQVVTKVLVKALMLLANLLESCDFPKFWETAALMDADLKTVPGFVDAIRRYIMITLSISYARVPKQTLCQALNMALQDLKTAPGASEFFEIFDEKSEM